VLRPGVVVELDASAKDVATAMPSADAWAWFEGDGAAEEQSGYRARRDARGWLTLREAAALIGCDASDARARLRALDKQEADENGLAVRRMCRWELVATATLRRHVARFGGLVSREAFDGALNTERAQHLSEPA